MHESLPIDDCQLLEAFARRNDHAAFGQLVERHARWIFAAAFRQLHDRHLAEDTVQIVFILLARRARAMNTRQFRKLSGWLFNALQFTVKDIRRTTARRLKREVQAAHAADQSGSEPPPSDQSVGELAEVLDAAVSRLPDRYRSVILLRFYQELSFDETAARLAITEAAARKRADRALARLRLLLGKPAGAPLLLASANLGSLQFSNNLASTAIHSALTIKPAALPFSLATSVKGVSTLMAITKLQTAAIAACAAILLIVPASFVAIHMATQLPASAPPDAPVSVPATVATAPDPHDFRQVYALKPGEFLRRVVALNETRDDMYVAGHTVPINPDPFAPPHDDFPELNGPMVIQWEGDKPNLVGMFPHAKAIALHTLLLTRLREFPEDTEGNAKDISIPGDFVYKEGGTPDDYRRALVDILQNDLKLPIAISYREIPRQVIVFRGKWRYQPAQNELREKFFEHAPPPPLPVIELFGSDFSPPNYAPMGSVRTAHELAGFIGSWINDTVVVEASGIPPLVDWHGNEVQDTAAAPSKAHDRTLVLNHITEQTGLKWSQETRTVRRLFVENLPPAVVDALPEFNRIYALHDGEFIRRVVPPFPESRWIAYSTESTQPPPSPSIVDDVSLIVGWESGARPWTQCTLTAGHATLSTLITTLLHVTPRDLEADSRFLRMEFPGDVVVRNDLTEAQRCKALEQFVENENGARLSIAFRDVQRDVYVLRGKWQYHPLDPLPQLRGITPNPNFPQIHVYNSALGGPQWSHSGESSLESLTIGTSHYFHFPVYIEAENLPEYVACTIHYTDADKADPATVMNHLAEQTGLTWTKESRTLRHLFVEPAK